MKRKYFIIVILLLFCLNISTKAVEINEKLSQIGFHQILQKDENKEIEKFFKKQQSYANKHDLKKIQKTYSPDFIDSDNIDFDSFIAGIKEVWDLYENIDYKTIVEDIKINGNYATVETTDTVQGTTKKPYDAMIEGNGIFRAEAKSYNYMQKINGEWKITATTVISETSSLAYGTAKNIPFSITAPDMVKANSEYEVTLKIEAPAKSGVIASILSEPISYPRQSSSLSQDIFRAVKADGELNRVLVANNQGMNEDAMACMSIAKAILDPKTKEVRVVIDGVAFASKRVNVMKESAK